MSNLATINKPTTTPAAQAATPTANEGTEIRGFALYVGATEAQLLAADTSLQELVSELRSRLAELAPGTESFASLAVAPTGVGGRDVDVVRFALGEPAARAKQQRAKAKLEAADRAASGVTVDLGRKRVLLDNIPAPLTFREFELLQFFVLREGQTVSREDVIEQLWIDAPAQEIPNARTIDVHIRRLRAKLGEYGEIIRTVRGTGYRFDRHADVRIVAAAGASPDF